MILTQTWSINLDIRICVSSWNAAHCLLYAGIKLTDGGQVRTKQSESGSELHVSGGRIFSLKSSCDGIWHG